MQHDLGLIQSSVEPMERLVISLGSHSGGTVTMLHGEPRTHLLWLHSVPLSSHQAELNPAEMLFVIVVIVIVIIIIERSIFTAVKVSYK